VKPAPDIIAMVNGDPGPEAVPMTRGKGRKTLLASPPPGTGASRDQLAAWLTVALALGADPVSHVERYGRGEEARMVIVLRSSRRVTFERASDAFDARRLERIVVLATGAETPHYAAADTAAIAGAIVRAADTLAEEDARGEAREWGRTFLQESEPNAVEVADLATPHGRYEALCILSQRRPPDPYLSPASRAVIVRDALTGLRWIRTGDVGAHVRAEGTRISWGALHARMVEAGWQHLGEVQQRQPKGHEKAKADLFGVSGEWDQ
jgi:hypothetical protein